MVKDHWNSERGNPLPPHGIAHTMAFVTPVVEHWLEREIAQWVDPTTTHRTMSERSYHRAPYKNINKRTELSKVKIIFRVSRHLN